MIRSAIRRFTNYSILKKQHKTIYVQQSIAKYSVNIASKSEPSDEKSPEQIQLEIPGLIEKLSLNQLWLRHHCLCTECFNFDTHQRNVIPANLPKDPLVTNILTSKSRGIEITWNDGHKSQFDLKWLLKNSAKNLRKPFQPRRLQPQSLSTLPWPSFKPLPDDPFDMAISYRDLVEPNSDLGLYNLIKSILDFGFGLVLGSPADVKSTKRAVQRIAEPMSTIFGKDMCLSSSGLEFSDTAYTSENIYLHTDNTYFSEPSGLEIFHCLEHQGEGGINSIADGFRIAKQLWEERPDYYEVLANISIPFQYIEKGKHCFLQQDVILTHNFDSGLIERIRFNPHDIGTLNTIPLEEIPLFYQSLIDFSKRMESSSIWLKLNPGTIIFLDNWRMFHGRSKYTGLRTLASAYISRSDWRSKANFLGLL